MHFLLMNCNSFLIQNNIFFIFFWFFLFSAFNFLIDPEFIYQHIVISKQCILFQFQIINQLQIYYVYMNSPFKYSLKASFTLCWIIFWAFIITAIINADISQWNPPPPRQTTTFQSVLHYSLLYILSDQFWNHSVKFQKESH